MTLAELLGLWGDRDSRYSMRKKNGAGIYLTEEEVASIRAYRWTEVLDLADEDQSLARLALDRWSPPAPMR